MRKLIMSMMLIVTSIIFTGCSGLFYNTNSNKESNIIVIDRIGFGSDKTEESVEIYKHSNPNESKDESLMISIGSTIELNTGIIYFSDMFDSYHLPQQLKDEAMMILNSPDPNAYLYNRVIHKKIYNTIIYADRFIQYTNLSDPKNMEILFNYYPQYNTVIAIVYHILSTTDNFTTVEKFRSMGIELKKIKD